ncbi:kinase-like domain-containing protein [Lactifluus subvellereus]|nr:kinase-like domain-containing protein [Lactifluus subvellereus]
MGTNTHINGHYKLGEKLGSGSYGSVYRAIEINSQAEVILKIARSGTKGNALRQEYHILGQLSNCARVPKALWLGCEDELHVMALERLGPSLEECCRACGGKLSLNAVTLIAKYLLSCLQDIHSHHYIHCDIKPSNILSGFGDHTHQIYLVDFGVAQKFRDPRTHAHIPLCNNLPLSGTPAFTSIHSHLGFELSRCDDLESLVYVLIYLLQGSLPWIGIGSKDLVLQLKQQISACELCTGLPEGFALILEYSRSLAFSKKPDYVLLESYIQDICATLPHPHCEMFDWQLSPSIAIQEVKLAASKDPRMDLRRCKSAWLATSQISSREWCADV